MSAEYDADDFDVETMTTGELVDAAQGLADELNEVIRDLERRGAIVKLIEEPSFQRCEAPKLDRIVLTMTFRDPR